MEGDRQTGKGCNLRIGELARRTAMTVDGIRFYEKRGLLPQALRTAGRFRQDRAKRRVVHFFAARHRSCNWSAIAFSNVYFLDAVPSLEWPELPRSISPRFSNRRVTGLAPAGGVR